MGEYLFSARSRAGVEVKESVQAESAAAVIAALKRHGFEDIVIHTDDFQARMFAANFAGELPEVPAEELIRAQQEGNGPLRLLWNAFKGNALLLVPLLAWNGYSLLSTSPLGWSDWLGFAITAFFLYLIGRVIVSATLFDALLRAQLWGKWQEADRRLRQLRRVNPAHIAPHLLDMYEAKNLIGLGRVDEGLALFDCHFLEGMVPEPLLKSLKASLLDQARRKEAAGRLLRKVTEAMPDSAQVWLDYAVNQAFYGDRSTAREALERAKACALTPIMAGVVVFVEGELALGEQRYGDAATLFAEALLTLKDYASQLALAPLFAVVEGRYAVAMAYCGKWEAAVKAWELAGPIVEIQGDDKLVADWNRVAAALGKAS